MIRIPVDDEDDRAAVLAAMEDGKLTNLRCVRSPSSTPAEGCSQL